LRARPNCDRFGECVISHQPIAEKAVKDIRKHFGYLFDRGYEIYSVKDYPEAPWPVREVILKKEDLFLKIYEERGYPEEMTFESPSKGSIDIKSMIYFLSDGSAMSQMLPARHPPLSHTVEDR
jgi:hypothetical protein